MGRTLREIRFSIIIDKYEHWDKDHLEECENSTSGYDDYAIGKLEAVMRKAGEQFVNENDDLFAGELM